MLNKTPARPGWMWIATVAVVALLTACNLGPAVPEGTPTPTLSVLPQAEETATSLVPEMTNTPLPLGPTETLGPVTIEGTLRTQTKVTVRVKRGQAVADVSCLRTLQDTGESVVLEKPTTNQLEDGSFEDIFTFTPDKAGIYIVSCTGSAVTATGLRDVDAKSNPFTVEAKG
jgi:hypothetical protein